MAAPSRAAWPHGEGMPVLVPGGVVLAVHVEPPGRTLLAGRQHPLQPAVGLVPGDPVGVGVRGVGELVDLVADGHAQEVRPVGEGRGQRAQVLRLSADHVRIGEEAAPVPGPGPGGQEVEARQVPLQSVHVDVEPALGGRVGERHELLDGARPDQRPVRLEDRPQREDADVVQPERGDRVEVGPDLVEVEVQPVVEPAAGGV